MSRTCIHCGCDISARHYHAKQCLACHKWWGAKTGAAVAMKAVNDAVRRGELAPAKSCTCADCGAPAIDYDHRDYNRPLDVQPVCRSCNKKRGPAIPAKEAA